MNLFAKTTVKKNIFFVAGDVFSVFVAVWLAFLFRFDFSVPSQYFSFIYIMIGLSIVFILPVFYFQKLYSFSWSYVSTDELISLLKAVTIAGVFLSIAIFVSYYFPHFINFPRSTIFISYLLIFVFCGALRFSKRIYLRIMGQQRMPEKERTLIVGAGDPGEQILRSIISSNKSHYYPVGFVDDNPIKKGVLIHGIKVLGKISDIAELVEHYQIRQLIIALPSVSRRKIKEAVELGKKSGVKKIKIAPPLYETIQGQVSFKNLKDVEVEDLLGREQVTLDLKQIESFIKGRAILVTGAAGSIGSELSEQIARFKPGLLILLDQDETGIFTTSGILKNKYPDTNIQSLVADVQDRQKIEAVFATYKPAIVFHAAAYKHVPLMEQQPDEAIKNNIFGTRVLLDASIAHGVEKFVFISTDKAVNPTSVMGVTKRIGEMMCQVYNQKNATKFISVRFGNVLNSRGSVIPIFKEQIKRGGPVEVTHPDMKRYFMLTSEACLLVMQAGAMGHGGEVFVLDMGKPIQILDLAKEMIRLSGFVPDKDIAIIFTGMRPGEKLFEEMLTAEEGTLATQNQKIFMAKISQVNVADMNRVLDDLAKMVYQKDALEIINELKKILNDLTHARV